MDYIVHGILQARILEWVALPFSRGSSQPRDQTQVSHIAGGVCTRWAAREAWRQARWPPIPISLRIFQFVVLHRVKGFSVVNEAEVDVFLGLSCFFYDPTDDGNLISGSSTFSKSSLYIWKFSVHVLLEPSLKDFEHGLASMWNEYNCAVVWAFFGIALLWDWNENGPFPVLWPLLSVPNLLAYWVQHLNSF